MGPTGASALILVDVQEGSITESTEHILPALKSFLSRHRHGFRRIVATRFVNDSRSPVRTVIGTTEFSDPTETELCEIVREPDIEVLTKGKYSAVTKRLVRKLRAIGVTDVYLAGTDTDMCVLHTAVGLFDAHLVPRVLEDLCASTGGDAAHRAGLLILRRCLGEGQVVKSSLFDRDAAVDPTPALLGGALETTLATPSLSLG